MKTVGSFVRWVLWCVFGSKHNGVEDTFLSRPVPPPLDTTPGWPCQCHQQMRWEPSTFIYLFSSPHRTRLTSFFLPFSFSDLWSISDLFPLNNLSFLAWYMCVCVSMNTKCERGKWARTRKRKCKLYDLQVWVYGDVCSVWMFSRAVQLIACDSHAHLDSKASSVISSKSPSPVFRRSSS